jgi:hypothetical protein
MYHSDKARDYLRSRQKFHKQTDIFKDSGCTFQGDPLSKSRVAHSVLPLASIVKGNAEHPNE